MGVGEWVEPALGHGFFGGVPVIRFEQGHGQGFDVQGGVGEGVFSGKSDEIPVDECEIKACRVGDKDGFSGQIFQPLYVVDHGNFRGLAVAAAGIPGFLVLGPPGHGVRVSRCFRKGLQVCRECAEQGLVCKVGGRGKAEHGVWAGDGAV